MTPEKRQQIKEHIESEIARLRESLGGMRETSKTVSLDQPIGRLSRMDSLANQAISGRALAEAQARLRRLEAALARVEDEDFGVCAECGEDIPPARLRAVPEATLCVECAQNAG